MQPEYLLRLAAVFFLLAASFADLRERILPIPLAVIFTCLFALLALLYPGRILPDPLAFLPGLLLLALSFATRGGIGTGDAVALLVLGLYDTPLAVTAALIAGLAFSACYAGIRYFVMRSSLHRAFAFLPFLFLGYVVRLAL